MELLLLLAATVNYYLMLADLGNRRKVVVSCGGDFRRTDTQIIVVICRKSIVFPIAVCVKEGRV